MNRAAHRPDPSPWEALLQRLGTHPRPEPALPARAQAAVALLLVEPEPGAALELLLIERALRTGDPWSGHMALPGGRREASDADLLATALRETQEETAVELSGSQLLGALADLRPLLNPERELLVRPYVFALRGRPAVRASAEVARYDWVSARALRASLCETEMQHGGRMLRLPTYCVGERRVWGMTQRILAPVLDLL
jgi:8-oxo-dGTP pyrophosphatase MutT (NUDIX family)